MLFEVPTALIPCVWLESGASRVGADPSSRLFGWKTSGLGWLQEGIFHPDVGWLRPPKNDGRSQPSWVPSLARRRLRFARTSRLLLFRPPLAAAPRDPGPR